MNYRHAYHAGNAADVTKHAVLALLLERLKEKPAAFMVLDTHAGIGRYDLDGTEARKTGEADSGIRRVIAAPGLPAEAAPYLEAVRAMNAVQGDPESGALRIYPGSPRLTRALMRPQDRLILAELHPDDAETLRQEFRADRQVAVHHMDGWLSLKAHLPPKTEKRGLVLIDPPFEATDEYDRLVQGLRLAHGRWPTGIYALWYPIKERATIWRFHQGLEESGIPKILAAELIWHPEDRHDRLNGCGMILVNPPWRIDLQLQTLLPALHAALGAEAGGAHVDWIAPE